MITTQVAVSQNLFTLTADGFKNSQNMDQDFVVLNYEGKSQSELYTKFLSKITNVYVSAKNVVSKVDDNIISINGYSTNAIEMKKGKKQIIKHDIRYNISFEFKDGRVRVNAPDGLLMTSDRTILKITGQTSSFYGQYAIFKNGELNEALAKDSLETFFNDLITEIASNEKDEW